MHTSNTTGPAYTGYLAALTILDAEVLLSTLTVKDWLDPSRRPAKGVEKHHLFPKDYLKQELGYTSTRQINQVANQALVEWSDNIDISNDAPNEYWPRQVEDKTMGEDRLARQRWWHGLPDVWTDLSYEDFLDQRRRLLAQVTREGFRKLSDPNYQPSPALVTATTVEVALPTFEQMVRTGTIPPGTYLIPTDGQSGSIAEVTEDGQDSGSGDDSVASAKALGVNVRRWKRPCCWTISDGGRVAACRVSRAAALANAVPEGARRSRALGCTKPTRN